MKKYARHLFSLLMVICMMGSIVVPAAQAADAGKPVNKPVAGMRCIDLDGQVPDIVSEESTPENQAQPRIIVNRGIRAFLTGVIVCPVRITYDGSNYNYYPYPGAIESVPYSPSSPTAFVNISSARTSELISTFINGTSSVPNAWLIMPSYNFYKAGDGSYPKYFQFDLTEADGTVTPYKVTLSKSAPSADIRTLFPLPLGETAPYTLSVWGGFYYYNGSANGESSTMAGVKVHFNT